MNPKSYFTFKNCIECNFTSDGHIESPGELFVIQIAGPHCESLRFSKLGLALENMSMHS